MKQTNLLEYACVLSTLCDLGLFHLEAGNALFIPQPLPRFIVLLNIVKQPGDAGFRAAGDERLELRGEALCSLLVVELCQERGRDVAVRLLVLHGCKTHKYVM